MGLTRRARARKETLARTPSVTAESWSPWRAGDAAKVQDELLHHGDLNFLDGVRHLASSPEADAWLAGLVVRGRWSPTETTRSPADPEEPA